MIVLFAGQAAPNDVQINGEVDFDDEDNIVSGLTAIAITGIEDPVRPEVMCGCLDCVYNLSIVSFQ